MSLHVQYAEVLVIPVQLVAFDTIALVDVQVNHQHTLHSTTRRSPAGKVVATNGQCIRQSLPTAWAGPQADSCKSICKGFQVELMSDAIHMQYTRGHT